jgi:hypothetical protein
MVLPACQNGGGGHAEGAPRPSLLVGAHYYFWYPERFLDGTYLRSKLLPAQRPLLGEYTSASTAVVEQHIAWARAAGIDFFTLDWWPDAADRNGLIDSSFLAARNLDGFRFCVFYETGVLGYDEATGQTVFDERAVERFLSDTDTIAQRYFAHPGYLRVAGRPVLILYVTRTATGRFPEAMGLLRSRMAARGWDPFVIGDEIFWEVARADGSGTTTDPQPARVALFDAITAYNLYAFRNPRQSGYGRGSTFLSDSLGLYERYRDAAGGRPVIPLALPGYNDRAYRTAANHYVIPRQWGPGDGEGTFFVEWLRRFSIPMLDGGLPMLLVTSWNEWNEDTAIEPLALAPVTASDESAPGTLFTQGFRYEGYGMRYLQTLREETRR